MTRNKYNVNSSVNGENRYNVINKDTAKDPENKTYISKSRCPLRKFCREKCAIYKSKVMAGLLQYRIHGKSHKKQDSQLRKNF